MQLLKLILPPFLASSVWFESGSVTMTQTCQVLAAIVAFEVVDTIICEMPTMLIRLGLNVAVADRVTVLLAASYVALTVGVTCGRLNDALNIPAPVDWTWAGVSVDAIFIVPRLAASAAACMALRSELPWL